MTKIEEYIPKFEKKFNCKLEKYESSTKPIVFKHTSTGNVFKISYSSMFKRVDSEHNRDLYITQIWEEIEKISFQNGFKWNGVYESAKTPLTLTNIEHGYVHKVSWDHLKHTRVIRPIYNPEFIKIKARKNAEEKGFLIKESDFSTKTSITLVCKNCQHERKAQAYLINTEKITHCTNCKRKLNRGGINPTTILRNRIGEKYFLYFLKCKYNYGLSFYKIGLFPREDVRNRLLTHKGKVVTLFSAEFPIEQAYYLEQKILQKFSNFKLPYLEDKFSGWTECFSLELPWKEVILYLLPLSEEIQNSEPCELLESLEADNQQPSLNRNILKGSETRSESRTDNNSPKSAGHLEKMMI